MKIKRAKYEKITITGNFINRQSAFDYCERHGFNVISFTYPLGPDNSIDVHHYVIIAEKVTT